MKNYMIFERESAKFLIPLAAILVFTGRIDGVLAQAYPLSNPRALRRERRLQRIGFDLRHNERVLSATLCVSPRRRRRRRRNLGGHRFIVLVRRIPSHWTRLQSSDVVLPRRQSRDLAARLGLAWSFASALSQATAAVALVALFSALLRATATTMEFAVDLVELVSYALIMLIGLRLLFAKGRGLFTMLRQVTPDVRGWSRTRTAAL
jgi:hypothetical protein